MMDGGFSRSDAVRARNVEYLTRLFGGLAGGLLFEPDVTDILLNPALPGEAAGRLWVVRLGKAAECVGTMNPIDAESFIVGIASTLDAPASRESPVVEGLLLLDGSRFEGILPPCVPTPAFAIRRKASSVFPLSEYVARKQMTQRQMDRIDRAVVKRENVLVVGGTGAGKTTLVNALLLRISELTPDHRLVGIEDTGELQNKAVNAVFMQADEHTPMRKLVRTAMRLFPHRIIVGEVRGPESLDMLMAMNTGHEGSLVTLHSNITTPHAALTRLESMVAMATQSPMQKLIAEAIGLIVCVELNAEHRRRVSQIVSVLGWDARSGEYQLHIEDE